ncbi:MAG: HlyC/CorC family transporter [Candidatus Riflebacteria bacterium]|nr:HlyC/CorC family transporter [Candidatus Riflebacteria bacterium]
MTTEQCLFSLGVAVVLILGNAFFVAAEFALVRVRITRLDELVQGGSRQAARTRDQVKQINEYLSACQLGITVASLGLGWIGEPAFASLVAIPLKWVHLDSLAWVRTVEVVLAFSVITYLHIVLGEQAPKALAIQYAEEVSLSISWPMQQFYRLSRPFIRFINWSGNTTIKFLGVPPPADKANAHSPEELRLLLHESHRSGTLTLAERELLENAFDFSDRTVRQVMRPRGEIVYLSLQESLEKSLERARKNGYTRYPICADDVDHVLGLVHLKDLLWPTHEIKTAQDLLSIKRDILFVPEMIGIPALLTEMRRKKVLMAIAVDEYGVVSGICTMEDILEELVGEIQDEFDQEHPEIRPTKDGGFLIEGTVLIEDLNRHLLLSIADRANTTISGHILSRLGRMASAGDSLAVENYQVRVVEVKGLRVSRLLFTPMTPRALLDGTHVAPKDQSTGPGGGDSVPPGPRPGA